MERRISAMFVEKTMMMSDFIFLYNQLLMSESSNHAGQILDTLPALCL